MNESSVQTQPEVIVFQPHPKDNRFLDLTGISYGRLTVQGYAGAKKQPSGQTKKRWWCRCACGNMTIAVGHQLKDGTISSCGCEFKEHCLELSFNRLQTLRERRSWAAMKTRCYNKNDKSYPDYGGRGITVCDRWLDSFPSFLQDMGRRPSANHSLDRISNDGNYEPGNCRWATKLEQSTNRRNVKIISRLGKALSVTGWSREIGVGEWVLRRRLRVGWTIEDALTKPVPKVRKRVPKIASSY